MRTHEVPSNSSRCNKLYFRADRVSCPRRALQSFVNRSDFV